MAMVRKQVYIPREQERDLKRCARQQGVTESELIRQGIALIAGPSSSFTAEEEEAWQDLERLWDERSSVPSPASGRTWKREDAYEERFARLLPRH